MYNSKDYTQVYEILYASPELDKNAIYHHYINYLYIPVNVRKALHAHGYKIYIDNVPRDDLYYNAGKTYSPKYIKWSDGDITLEQSGYIDIYDNPMLRNPNVVSDYEYTVIHEIGHAVDYIYNGGFEYTESITNVSNQNQWTTLYETYKDNLRSLGKTTAINLYSPAECFAECFALYILKPKQLYAAAPEIYIYVGTIINSFKG